MNQRTVLAPVIPSNSAFRPTRAETLDIVGRIVCDKVLAGFPDLAPRRREVLGAARAAVRCFMREGERDWGRLASRVYFDLRDRISDR